jgi:Uma2 family endonuclease
MATPLSQSEDSVILRSISWKTYEDLLSDFENQSAPRLAFDRGVLEIMSPSPEHEKYNRALALLVEVVAEEIGLDVENLGSATFKRQDLLRGFEPASCFYIQNADGIRGKTRIDLEEDPPPDLIIEIDITSRSLNKLPIYAQIGVPEVWHYDGAALTILVLDGEQYKESEYSVSLSPLTASVISNFVETSRSTKRREWLRTLREWMRANKQPS